MDDPFDLFDDEDYRIFYTILIKLDHNLGNDTTITFEEFKEIFGEGSEEYLFRLVEKNYVKRIKTTGQGSIFYFFDITDAGIEALKTIYDPEILMMTVENAADEVMDEKEEKSFKYKQFHWTIIGIISSIILGMSALTIAILAYYKS